MNESMKASDRLAEKIAQIDEEIAHVKDEALLVSQHIAQLQLRACKQRVKELHALREALAEIQQDALKEESK